MSNAMKVAAAVVLLVGGCAAEHDCTTEARAGLVVVVTNVPGGTRVCDATVTAREGAFSETLMRFGGAADCEYSGVYERAGTYSVEVVSGSADRTVENAVVAAGDCHVMTRDLTISLGP